jgi:hypothetical protein
MATTDLGLALAPRHLVYLEHHRGGRIKVRLSGQAEYVWAHSGREQALRFARAWGGSDAVIFESLGGVRS